MQRISLADITLECEECVYQNRHILDEIHYTDAYSRMYTAADRGRNPVRCIGGDSASFRN